MSIYTKICGINDTESGLLCSNLELMHLGLLDMKNHPGLLNWSSSKFGKFKELDIVFVFINPVERS